MKTKGFTEGQRFLMVWIASVPTRCISSLHSVPGDAPQGTSMEGLRGLERRGYVREQSTPGLFKLTIAGLRTVLQFWRGYVEEFMRYIGRDHREIGAMWDEQLPLD